MIAIIGTLAGAVDNYLILEDRTSDYAAEAANHGKMWMRSDLATATVKGVIKSYSGSPPAAVYEVKTYTIS
jgi:hypothetical protein